MHTYSRYALVLNEAIIQIQTDFGDISLMNNWLTKITTICLLLIVATATIANTTFEITSEQQRYLSHKVEGDTLLIKTSQGRINMKALSNNALSVAFTSNQANIHAQHLSSFAIKEHHQASLLAVTDKSTSIIVNAGSLSAKISKSPFGIKYFRNGEPLISEAGFFTGKVTETTTEQESTTSEVFAMHGVRFSVAENEKFLGAGERVLGMDRRGHRLPLYNRAHYGYETYSEQMNFSLPAVMSDNKYLVLFDNTAKGWIDIGKTEKNTVQFEAVAGRNAYVIIAGDTYPNLINHYVDITGKQPMPPRWALGNFASRFGYRTQAEVMDTVSRFHSLDIPLDAVILDLYWFGKDIKGHMGNLAWDKEAFPAPEKMMADLLADNVQPILITEPFILSSSKRWQDAVEHGVLAKDSTGQAKTFDFYFGNTGIVDVFNDKGRTWFNNIYTALAKQGVQGWWGDLGEPEVHPADALHTLDDGSVVSADAIHNAYGHQWAKMVFDNLQELKPNERPFILMRSGFAGSQRYGMIPWTGDVNRTWGGLQPQVELSLQMSMFGLGYTHSDLGGFAGGEVFNKELYIRWLQYGVFQPVYRPHAQEHIPSEVVFHDKETQDILRKFIQLRYQLLPYNYTLAYQNSVTGMPLMRPTFFNDNKDFLNTQSYLWGDAFFVQPIVKAGMKTINVALPEGVWFNYWTGERFIGGQSLQLANKLNEIPVFVKAGAFVPMIASTNNISSYKGDTLKLHYYADSSIDSASGIMYDDDGISMNAIETSAYELFSFEASANKQTLAIDISAKGKGYRSQPAKRKIEIIIHNWSKQPKRIKVDGQVASQYRWNEGDNTLSFTVDWQQHPIKIKITKNE